MLVRCHVAPCVAPFNLFTFKRGPPRTEEGAVEQPLLLNAGGGIRTLMARRPPDFKSTNTVSAHLAPSGNPLQLRRFRQLETVRRRRLSRWVGWPRRGPI